MKPFLFVTDLDNTLVNHTVIGADDQLVLLNQILTEHRQNYGSKIVYATGRSPVLYRQLKEEKNLIDPDGLIVSVGTEIYLENSETPDASWSEKLSHGWNKETVVEVTSQFPELIAQPETEQRPFKVSFFLKEELSEKILPELESKLQKCALNIKLIYSSGIDLDIVPRDSDKGQAVQFLRQKWEFVAEQTVVCGDSGNDISLFATGQERGILVGNALKELLEWYSQNRADYHYLAVLRSAGGIIEGLKHFGFVE